jgi:hypothetical protein
MNKFRPTKAHIVYGELLKRSDLIEIDSFRENPSSRETIINIGDKKIIMYCINNWLEYPLVFFSDMKFNLIDNTKFLRMAGKYVKLK